jgi:tripartite ATP-independent transporter DctM subunit
MSLEVLGLVLLATLFVVICAGFPISFTLLVVGFAFGYVGLGEQVFHLLTFQIFSTMMEPVLAAVALFTFMGYLLEQAGLMDRLFRAFQLLCGSLRGSLYLATIVTATIFAAATGITGASVTVIGLMAAPAMQKSGYSPRLAAGTITAGGTLGILIPPSIMLVVMGAVLEISVARLYVAAILPGLLLSALYLIYTLTWSYLRPSVGPPLPAAERNVSRRDVIREFGVGLVPPGALILATLGAILSGFATPTEGAALGCLGAVLVALAHRRLTPWIVKDAVFRTAQTTSMVMILLAASNFFGSVFSRFGTPRLIAESVLALDVPPALLLLGILLVTFVLGWPLEWVPIVVIIMPMFVPIITKLGVPLLWFAILMAVTLQTCWLSPPVALSAYYLKGIMPQWELKEIYLGMAPFMLLQILGALVVFLFPELALMLPRLLYGR